MRKQLRLTVYKDLHGGGYRLLPGCSVADLPLPSKAAAQEFAACNCLLDSCNMHGGIGGRGVANYYYMLETLLVENP